MPEMTFEQVKALVCAYGLKFSDEDLREVTHRLNATIRGVEKFSHPDLATIDPVPFRALEEAENGQ